MAPAEAVRGFLDALGVPSERIPAGLEAQVSRYRSLFAGKRILIVLDNARDAAHARPLLPGTPTAVTVVVSRNRLTPLLVTDRAYPLTLDLRPAAEARELLARRLDSDRVTAEPQAVEHIMAACAGLPLALSIAAARAQQTGFPLATITNELEQAGQRLSALDAGDAASDVRAVFSWSYHTLTPPAARLFRLRGLHPDREISTTAAASATALQPAQVKPLLTELARANLITERIPGRYTFHDLLHAYAVALTGRVRCRTQVRRAVGRVARGLTGIPNPGGGGCSGG